MKNITINPDITAAETLSADFYRNPDIFEIVKEKIFARTWLYAADATIIEEAQMQYPFTLLKGVLDEPLLFSNDKDNQLHCLSNVCTHRGKIIVEKAGKNRMLSCGYHGRCFRLDGSFKSMPAFEEAKNFPTPNDDLASIAFKKWAGLLFVSLDPAIPFQAIIQPMIDRLGWLPLDKMVYNKKGSKDYYIDANWALYCDNYLEGLHIPFVHPALNEAIVFEEYTYEISKYCNLQLGVAKDSEPCFDLPEGHVDYGKNIYAYYYWVFPNLMFNFYPWGLSLNIVTPLSHNKTKVSFRSYILPDTPFDPNANRLDDTEMEDEAVVESVQLGIQSRFYNKGRFSPKMEKAVHHFHSLIADFINA